MCWAKQNMVGKKDFTPLKRKAEKYILQQFNDFVKLTKLPAQDILAFSFKINLTEK